MSKNRTKDLYLDRPTSHGGWGPDSDNGSWNNKKPVYQQISDYLESMGLLDDNPRARLYESNNFDYLLLETKEQADELAVRLEDEAIDQGLALDSSMSFKNLAIALLGTVGSSAGKLFFGAGYLIDAGLIVKGLINLSQSFNSLVEADDIVQNYLGYRPLSLRGVQTLSQDDILKLNTASPEDLLQIRKLIIAAVQYRVKGIIALLSGIPDEFLGFVSAPLVVGLASTPVDNLFIQTKKIFSGILDALPILKRATERNDLIGKILGVILKSNSYNLGKLYRVLQVAPPASGDGQLEVIVSMDDIADDVKQNLKTSSLNKRINSDPADNNLDRLSEVKLRNMIRTILLEKIYR